MNKNDVKILVYQFVVQLGFPHKFINETDDLFVLFMSGNPDLSMRKAEGISLARS